MERSEFALGPGTTTVDIRYFPDTVSIKGRAKGSIGTLPKNVGLSISRALSPVREDERVRGLERVRRHFLESEFADAKHLYARQLEAVTFSLVLEYWRAPI